MRVFLLTGDYNQRFFCNIEEFGKCYAEFNDKNNVKIQHFWNGRFVKCSKKSVLDMCESLKLENPFK